METYRGTFHCGTVVFEDDTTIERVGLCENTHLTRQAVRSIKALLGAGGASKKRRPLKQAIAG